MQVVTRNCAVAVTQRACGLDCHVDAAASTHATHALITVLVYNVHLLRL